MKKCSLIAFVLLAVLCGCSTGSSDDYNDTQVEIVEISFDDNSVTNSESEPLDNELYSAEEETGSDEAMEEIDLEEAFYISEIDDDTFTYIYGKSYKENCTVPREELRLLHITYVNFSGETATGQMIVNELIAEDVLDIFKELYEAKYPIEEISLVDKYDANDEESMAANNTSAFNFRFVSGTTTVSKHGLGLAIDINPLYNPYIWWQGDNMVIEPANSSPYADRSFDFPHKIDENDLAYQLFTEHGFIWGGSWNSRKDYQHFEFPSDH